MGKKVRFDLLVEDIECRTLPADDRKINPNGRSLGVIQTRTP